MNRKETEKYIKSGLSHIENAIYEHIASIDRVRYCRLGYGQRERVLEDTEGWEDFDCSDTWGGLDSHFCFAAKVRLPEAAAGRKTVLRLETGAADIWNTDNPQFLAYVNGVPVCGMDMNHHEAVLSESASAGESVDVRLYAYCNSERKSNFLYLTVLAVNTEIEQCFYDLKVPFEAAFLMRDEDPAKTELYQKLEQAMDQIDFRMKGEALAETLQAASKFAEREIYRKASGDMPEVYSVGHTHIDVAWKWPVRQTREKALRSFQTVLSLMREYPDYLFLSSQPQLYQFVKEESPEVFGQIRERVKEGRWETEGGMWLEADCNLSSGESLIRQIFYGKKFFQEEFGRGDNVVLWLPDVFGYSAALPQIMKKTGMKYFMTTKIGWNERNKFPNDTIWWEGIDGSRVLAHFITTRNYCSYPELNRNPDISVTYNGMENASQIMGTWQRYQNQDLSKKVLTCYGYGDGGGGTTRKMIEEGRRLSRGIPGCPGVRFSKVRDFFEDLEEEIAAKKVPDWCGELYLEFHRGTYTSMAQNKKGNRKSEFLLQDTEWLAALAEEQCGLAYPKERLEKAWKLLLLNQFHDILPGTCIEEVYIQTEKEYEQIRQECKAMIEDSVRTMERQRGIEPADWDGADCLSVYNPLSFTQDCVVTLPGTGWTAEGAEILQQTWNGNTLCLVRDVPAKGRKACGIAKAESAGRQQSGEGIDAESVSGRQSRGGIGAESVSGRQSGEGIGAESVSRNAEAWKNAEDQRQIPCAAKDGAVVLETPFYQVEIQPDGRLSRLYDKAHGRNLCKPGEAGNALRIYDDRPQEYDAWNIDEAYERKYWMPEASARAELAENGPWRYAVRVKQTYQNSAICQDILFYEDTPRIDFRTKIDWREHQQLLKAVFPLDLMSRKLVCDIQYGNVERPTHRNTSWEQAQFEMCMHKWIDLAEDGYGVAVLNDCKYGYSAKGSEISITLLKSGIFPNPNADIGVHEFTYSLYPHDGDFRKGKVIQEAYRLNCGQYVFPGKGIVDNRAAQADFSVDKDNVFAEVVKETEDQRGILVRFYEAYGRREKVIWNWCLLENCEVWECDMLERKERKLERKGTETELVFYPYEIKTVRVERGK